ncbi:MAG: GGDEF domain-containing protein [Proteobacteria bacterium]|nr:GGDEF domain-containing protein [Pseudomonadota bacterium]
MNVSHKNNHNLPSGDEKKTLQGFLKENEKTSNLFTEGDNKKPVTVIVLCDSLTPVDENILKETPHIVLPMEDDLLRKISELHEENIKLRSLALLDDLTGLFNSRFFRMQMEVEMARTKRTGHSCTLMMIDLDNFKLLNDTLGHLEGDRFLTEFGKIMHASARTTDLIYRYGGDEFAVIMPATAASAAVVIGQRFNNALSKMLQKTDPAISLSIGISEYNTFSSYDINDFIHAADLAMYKAKKEGKNRICVDEKIEKSISQDNELSLDEKEALLIRYDE